MQLSEYQKLTSRTNTDLGSKAINAAHCVLGIVGEWEELQEAVNTHSMNAWRGKDTTESLKQVNIESGDPAWYLSELANLFELEINPLDYYAVDESIGWIAENIKKFLAYNKPVDTVELSKRIDSIVFEIHLILDNYSLTLEQCLDDNIAKLRLRFPEKFSAELALAKGDEK